MPRGRQPRVVTATLPPKGYYISHLAPLVALREGRVTPAAVCLWSVMRAHAWQDGGCDLTDQDLGAAMGGMSARQISNLRAMLVEAGLLVIQSRGLGGARRLVPQPVIEAQSISGEIYFTRNALPEEEEVKRVKINTNTDPPPPKTRVNSQGDITQDARVNDQGGPGGIEMQCISPEIHFTGNGLPVNSGAAGDGAAAPAGPAPAPASPVQALAAFLVEQGAFPPVAAGLAPVLLARLALDAAQVYALALLTAIESSADVRQRRIYGEQIIGRWVARLRNGATPPRWAVEEAENALAARERAVDAEPAAEEWTEADAAGAGETSAAGAPEPEERPWIVGDGRACSDRELWDVMLAHLRLQLPRSTFETWLRGSRCAGLEGERTLVVQVGSGYAVEWLTLRLKKMVLRTLASLTGQDGLDVRFEEVS